MEELIKKAKSAIGEGKLDDYKITPTNFPDKFEKIAPEISKILKHSTFREIARRYEQHDASAIASQTTFKNFAHQATLSICFASLAGSLLAGLSAANLKPNNIITSLFFIFGLISTIGGGLAVYRLYQIKNEKLLEQWMAARAKAETERLGYFNSLSRYLVDNFRTNVYLHLLFIFMFKRYQLEVQRIYYTTRGEEHRASFKKTVKIGAVAALYLALGSGALGMIGAFFPDFLPIAALGTIGAAIGVVASRREDLNQDERNAERYGRTADILSKIVEKHDEVLAIVKNGKNPEVIIKYVDAVNDQLSLEHRQWTNDISEMPSALNTLEKSISNLHKG